MEILSNITGQHILIAFTIGIFSACSLPLGTITSAFWKPGDRAIAFLMAFGGGALLAALTIDLVGSALEKELSYDENFKTFIACASASFGGEIMHQRFLNISA